MEAIATMTGKIVLPSLILSSLAKLQLSDVDWNIFLCVFITKFITFCLVVAVSLGAGNSVQNSGCYAMFGTQSNDFALAYPILKAKFGVQLAEQVFVLAPITFFIIIPASLSLMKAGQANKDFYKDPVVLATVMGGLLSLGPRCNVLIAIFETLGKAFAGLALFLLGFNSNKMLGNASKDPLAVALVLTKLVVLPWMSVTVMLLLAPAEVDLARFVYLLGVMPVAPPVYVFAKQHGTNPDLIGGALMLTTFMSALFVQTMPDVSAFQTLQSFFVKLRKR